MTKEKVIFIIGAESFVRNYISSNVLVEIQEHYDCKFLINHVLENHPLIKPLENESFYNPNGNNFYDLIFDLFMWRNRKKSKSFLHRIKRTRGFNLHFNEKQSIAIKTLRIFGRLIRYLKYRLLYNTLANPIAFPFVFKLLNYFSKNNQSLEKEIIRIAPKLVIYPSNAYEAIGIDVVNISREQKIKSIFIIDNWDNISSKSILWAKPDRLLLWGEQTKHQAIKIQNFDPEKISCVGASRFDQYYKKSKEKITSHFNFNYILFTGFSLPFNEAKLVKLIDDILSRNKDIFGDTKLVYRPHPNRQGRDTVKGIQLKNTIVDPQLEDWYFNSMNKNIKSASPALDYYPSLLQNAEMIIASLTSMIIESLIFKKKTLIVAYKEARNPSSPYRVLHDYHHFDDLFCTEGIDICLAIENFENDLIHAWQQRNKLDLNKLEKDCNFLCHNDDKDYSKRIFEYCQKEIIEINT